MFLVYEQDFLRANLDLHGFCQVFTSSSFLFILSKNSPHNGVSTESYIYDNIHYKTIYAVIADFAHP